MEDLPVLYRELAAWWPLLSAPEDYVAEASVYTDVILAAASIPVREVLELGSGGGNNASHLKKDFDMTLVDLSPGMLAVSRELNPECRHLEGDMRSVRLGRLFDAVFVHDAVEYLTTESELGEAVTTAAAHCRSGGVVLFVPDHVTETFRPSTGHGGHDGDGKALRYLEWTRSPEPGATSYVTDMVYLLRDGDDISLVHDRHVHGLFPVDVWRKAFRDAGLEAEHRTADLGDETVQMFVAVREE